MNVNLPGARAWPTLPREFYVFFQQVANGVNDTSDLTDIATRLSAVEAAAKKPANGQVRGSQSIYTNGVLPNFVTFTLVNDAIAPGNGYVYGTDAAGGKGWRTTASMLAHTADTTLDVGADGVATIGLADATVTAGGTLKKRSFDAKGRLSQEADATTTDLAEGSNLYFTASRDYLAAKALLKQGANVTITPDDTAHTLTIASLGGSGGTAMWGGIIGTLGDQTDLAAALSAKADAATTLQSIVPGANVAVDATDPRNPIISATGGGGGVSVHVPFFVADGTATGIALTADQSLPFFLANGTASDVALTT